MPKKPDARPPLASPGPARPAHLATVTRGREPDTLHYGMACLVRDDGNILWSAGDPHSRAFLRSSAKPFQALPLLASGAADALGLDDRDLAVICGSHPGGPEALAQVRGILAKAGVEEGQLQCGDGVTDMCSGKHAGMLATCRHAGWPLENYLDPDHPLQRRILSTLADACLMESHELPLALDGCSAPTHALPLYRMALGFARLARQSNDGADAPLSAAGRLFRSMLAHPGSLTGEPDLRGFPASGGLLVTKGGAGGLLCAALPASGLGFALKIADGSPVPRWPVFIGALERAGILGEQEAGAMRQALWPPLLTRRGEPAGEIVLAF